MQIAAVAGGAGFIGSSLCRSLIKDSFEVICIDNLLTGDKSNIEDLFQNPKFKFIEHDITKKPSTLHSLVLRSRQLLPPNYIFHLASPASPNKKSKRSYINYPIETMLANSVGTYNLLEATRKSGARFLYASSSEIYGNPTVSPQKEGYYGNVNPNGIRSVYDEGKRFGEALTIGYVRKHRIDARVIRIFNTYGPNMQPDDGRVVSNFINQALAKRSITIYGDGSQTRSFCYVDDMIEGLKCAMFLNTTEGQVINLGNPKEMSILELAKLIKKMTNSSSEIIFEELPEDDPKVRKPDISKAKKLIEWEPKIEIKDGLRRTIQYFKHVNNI